MSKDGRQTWTLPSYGCGQQVPMPKAEWERQAQQRLLPACRGCQSRSDLREIPSPVLARLMAAPVEVSVLESLSPEEFGRRVKQLLLAMAGGEDEPPPGKKKKGGRK
jgi:hypothetical protein